MQILRTVILGMGIYCFSVLHAGQSQDLCLEASSKKEIQQDDSALSGRETLLSIVYGEWVAQSVYTATQLDIAGYLLDGPKKISEIALLSHSNEEHLYRLLRLLASVGIFHEEENQIFSNTTASAMLAKDHPQSLHSLILFYSQEMSQSWRGLAKCIQEGKPGFDLSFGQPVFEYFRQNPNSAQLFNAAMREKSRSVILSCLQSYDFKRFHSIYDIGGGIGHFLSALLQQNDAMQGVLYELPQVTEAAEMLLKPWGKRCERISGDFFASIPKGGDAYLLKSVLHDWSDQEALKILANCHQAMKDSSSLIIIEPIMLSPNQNDAAKKMDVYMMLITGGKERTEEDFKRLLSLSGFSIHSITPTETEFCIIEAHKKQGN